MEKLRDARWVIYSSEFNRHLERLLHAHDGLLSMQTAVEVKCLATALALMGVGAGLAAVPDYGRIFAPNFNVHFIKLRAPEIRRRYSIYQRRGRVLSPPAEAFVELLRPRAARGDGRIRESNLQMLDCQSSQERERGYPDGQKPSTSRMPARGEVPCQSDCRTLS